ncbi:AAA family ATPase [Paraburkholderia sp. MM5384-R2]|uniref:AAA family ATPase n=1 Tax=Paraburkholderia sp. MM5384-R2 TaxID=2723097 RepID=UPI001615CAF8|nr:AAA family ATPase [Paraburkholderia sp. MM5384-R2]MBB5501043.1 energy-coupling factor transporter ATP-binding protein EcfA2 [Paraburkholderia sp. MM5384-R2]
MAAARFNSTGTGVILESAVDIVMESPDWLWPGWLSTGKVHLLAGPPSCGKSTLAASIGAIISTGGRWPDGSVSPRGRVLIWSSEDRAEDTIIPRFVAAGADRSMIEVVRCVEESWMPRPFNPTRDMGYLENKIRELRDVRMVIIDSIADLMSGSPGNNGKVRKDMLPLTGLAERTGVAVVGLAHVVKASKKKHPLERILGGVGVGAVVRIAMLVARDDSGGFGAPGEWNVLVKAKSNLGRDDGGLLFRTEGFRLTEPKTGRPVDSSLIVWGSALPGTATAILHRAEGGEAGGGKVRQAADFLMSTLRDGPVPFPEIEARAAEAGISEATLRRAREQYGFGSNKQRGAGSASPHVWSMPQQGMSSGMAGGHSISDLAVSAPIVNSGYTSLFHGSAAHPGAMPNGSDLATYRGGFSSPQFASPNDARTFVAPPAQAEQHAQVEQVEQPERVEMYPQLARVPQPTVSIAGDASMSDCRGVLQEPQAETGMLAAFLGYALDEVKREIRRRPLPVDSQDQDEASFYYADVVESVVRSYEGDLTQPERQQLREALWAELLNCVCANQQ